MAEPEATWSEEDSRTFIDLADVAVPGRREQMDVVLSLVPAAEDDEFAVADLACGEGLFARLLLERYPRAHLTAFDGSETMLARAAERLSPFGERARVLPFDLAARDWLAELPEGMRVITSSLAVHHLEDVAKAALYRELAGKLAPGGALIIADVVEPVNAAARRAVISAWHAIACEQSLALSGSEALYRQAVNEGWAPPADDEPVPGEMPAPLFRHLQWLKAAGLSSVDCFWLRAGIAIYGGYR